MGEIRCRNAAPIYCHSPAFIGGSATECFARSLTLYQITRFSSLCFTGSIVVVSFRYHIRFVACAFLILGDISAGKHNFVFSSPECCNTQVLRAGWACSLIGGSNRGCATVPRKSVRNAQKVPLLLKKKHSCATLLALHELRTCTFCLVCARDQLALIVFTITGMLKLQAYVASSFVY